MTKVLVTGASGFIGRHLVPLLQREGHEVLAVASNEGDVADPQTWSRFPAVACVVHLAARSFVPDSWKRPEEFMRTNMLGTMCGLEFCRNHGARFVFLSSYMYGVPNSLPIRESHPLEARNPYALSKKLAEEACRFYAESFSVDVTIFRPFNVYGPGQSEPFLIPFLVRQITEGREIHVKDLAPRRDYVHVLDVASAVARAIDGSPGLHVLNLGSGQSHSVEEVINALQAVAGSALPIVSSADRRKDEIMDTVADIAGARDALGWQPTFTLSRGLKDIMQPTKE